MRIDVNAFVGEYPWRHLPGGTPDRVLAAMDRIGTDQAWVSHLGGTFWRDPTEANPVLYALADRAARLRPVPAIHPGLPEWESELGEAREREAPCIRADPTRYGVEPAGAAMRTLASACARLRLPLLLAVRLEDGRQRHPNDLAAELSPADVRALIRTDPELRLIVTHADREFVEQVHFGSTPAEAERILWDICWIGGPPEDHLELLLRTVGLARFSFGTGMPLRLPEVSVAKLDLLDLSPEDRARIEGGNLLEFVTTSTDPTFPRRTRRR